LELYSPGLEQTIVAVHGEAGRAWLKGLPGLIRECERRWRLRVIGPAGQLSYNFVALAEQADGSRAVLKLGVPHPELTNEMAALRLFNGRGAVQLLQSDPEKGILLLEYIQPGTPLSRMEDDERATEIAAQVMISLWRQAPPEHPFPMLAKWTQGLQRLRRRYEGGSGPLPERLLGRAEGLLAELLASASREVVLHGDFHHDNILRGERAPWLAIDPKGVVGDPGYEVGAFLYNPLDFSGRSDMQKILRRRVDQLSEALEIERERVAGYGLVQAVLSACWSIEDNQTDWEGVIRVGEVLADFE